MQEALSGKLRLAPEGGGQPPRLVSGALSEGSFSLAGRPTWFARNEEIYGEGEPSAFLYKIISGCVRTFNTLNDGRRRIEAFYIPGDIFGLDTRSRHNVSAQAITRCNIELIGRKSLMARAITEVAIVSELFALTDLELQRAHRHNLRLLRSAQERIVGFLLDMEERQANDYEIDLPMTRGDIADYLGLTTETVSRVLWKLESVSAIAIPKRRRVVLRNVPLLQSFGA